jgi:signal transduction histidine kinase
MRISSRLSLLFLSIASAVFIVFAITIYLLSSNHRKHEFQERLEERLFITEQIFLEKESYTTTELQRITDQFLHTLTEETEEVVHIQADSTSAYKYDYPPEVQQKIMLEDSLFFEDGDYQGVSRIFHVKGENYIVIVTAVDRVGLQNLSYLKNIIILLLLIGIPVISVGSFAITKQAFSPLSKKIDRANTLSASNLHERLLVYNPNDEIGKLAVAFNKLLDRLEASFEAQKSFISNASHEIRNPLTAILGEAEVALSKSRTSEEYVQSLTTVMAEGEKLNATVTNLLQLSKIEANEESIKHTSIQFDEFLNEVKQVFDFIEPKNKMVLNISKAAGSSNYAIVGNKNLLKTALINLLDNACKFSENKNVDVTLTQVNNQVQLCIKDKGIGIAQSDLEKILNPFYRGKNAIAIKGSGIGLSLTSKIISLHRGTLEIESQIDLGTVILVKLPLV